MNEFNPYAAPKAEIGATFPQYAESAGLWQDGRMLVIRKGTELPDRCLRCNEPAQGYRFKRTLSWHPAGWYLLLLLNLIIYVVVALCVRWTAKIAAPICPLHRAKRRRAITLGWIGSLAGIGLMIVGMAEPDYAIAILVGALLFLVSLVLGVAKSQLLIPKRIDKNFIWLKKVSPDFLAPLPDWRGEEASYQQKMK